MKTPENCPGIPLRTEFRLARDADADAVWQLYRGLLGVPFCPWDDTYPARENVDDDLAANALFVLTAPDAGVLAAGTVRRCAEHDTLAAWQSRTPGDLMRFGVAREYLRHGLGRVMLQNLCAAARSRGFDGMRILVADTNLPARKLYERAGAVDRGRAFTYGIHWVCMELGWGAR